jgi:hypothetical protein
MPILVAARSKASICSSSFAGIVGSNPRRGHGYLSHVNDVCCEGGGLCDGTIPHPEESYRLCLYVCIIECDQVQQKPCTHTINK